MTEKERQADLQELRKMETRLESVRDCYLKRAELDLIRATRLLLQQPPAIDNALTAMGMAVGWVANEMGL